MKPIIKPFIILLLIGSIINSLSAQKKQETKNKEIYSKAFFGLGFGLDYGGIGLKAEYLPVKYLSVFGGVGYNLVEPGFNFGLSAKILPGKSFCPYLIGMYGYNAALKVSTGFSEVRKSYYGISVGAGVDIRGNRNENKTSIAILVPFRSAEFNNTYEMYEGLGYKFSPKKLPVAFSIGYNFAIGNK